VSKRFVKVFLIIKSLILDFSSLQVCLSNGLIIQDDDPGNLYRNALKHFPDQGMAQRFIDQYYIEGGKAADKPYKPLAMWTLDAPQELREACVLGNF
jgi:hypothetical protein